MIYTEESMRKELEEARNKPVAYDAQRTYPFWELDDRVFEILLYQVFAEDIRVEHFKDRYDACTLMTGVGEQGRDVKLLRGGKNAGLVQGKRIQGAYGRPDAAKEIIKFCLFARLDRTLVPDPKCFGYYLAVANKFSGPAIALLDNVGEEMAKDPSFRSWIEEVLAEYKAFKDLTHDGVVGDLSILLKAITFRKITAHDLDQRLEHHPPIVSRFFSVRVVTDLEQTKEMIRELLSSYNLRQVTDDAIRMLSERIAAAPANERVDFGNQMFFGFHPEVLKRSIASGALGKVAWQGAMYHSDLLSLVLDAFSAMLKERLAERIEPLKDVSGLGKVCAKAYLANSFRRKFEQVVMGATLPSLLRKDRRVIRGDSKEQIIDEAIGLCECVRKKDFSFFEQCVAPQPVNIALVEKIYGEFHSADEARTILVRDFKFIDQLVSDIDAELSRLIPKKPTVIFTDSSFFDDTERMKKIIAGAIDLDGDKRKKQ